MNGGSEDRPHTPEKNSVTSGTGSSRGRITRATAIQDPRFYEALGRAIKVLRTERGLNRRDLAEDAEISYPYLSEIENGKKPPSSRALFALSDALGVRPHLVLETAESLAAGSWTGSSSALGRPSPESAGEASGSMSGEQESELLEELLRLVRDLPEEDLQRILDLARRLAS